MDSLDFTVPSAMALPEAPPLVAAAPVPSEPLPATRPASQLGFTPAPAGNAPPRPAAPPARPAVAPAPVAALPAAPQPVPAKLPVPSQGVSSVMMMEVEERPFEAAPVLEEAAILFANAQDQAALAALQNALKTGTLPPIAKRHAWMLLFDLLENLGRRDDFDAAAMEFAVALETSPPAYNDRSGVKDPTLETGGGQYFALTGALDDGAAKQFSQLANLSECNKILRIEFGKIEAVAEAGCKLLFDHLRGFKKSGHDLVFSSSEHLIKLLNAGIETGRRSDPEVYWLLLLEMYQFQNMQAVFEESALNYCITYEVSPPSWVEPVKPAASTRPPTPTSLQVPQDAFYLKGALEGNTDMLFKDAAAYAADKSLVVIDLFDVRRVAFPSAGAFLNLVTTLHGSGKELEIRSPSPLVAALFVSMGFMHHVRFTRRGK